MKSKNRAFTLVELIGVVAILSILLLVAVPALTKTLKNNEQKKYDSYIKNLESVTEQYIVKNVLKTETIDDDNPYYVSLKTLIDNGYMEDTMVNPETEKEISTDTRIKVTRNEDATFNYEIQEYYTSTDDYNFGNLIIHYDAVEYNRDNIMKNYAGEADLNYDENVLWTEEGINLRDYFYFDTTLNQNYNINKGTISFSFKNDELGENDYLQIYGLINIYIDKYWINSAEYGSDDQKNYTITIIFDNDSAVVETIYLNNEIIYAGSGSALSSTSYFYIEGEGSWTMNNLLVYDRALSDSEVKKIYELDKERFGE